MLKKSLYFCNEKLSVDISDKNIDRAHCVGKPREVKEQSSFVLILIRIKLLL